ncbi:MAG TPA: sodium/proline symporter PutP [Sedimentisphaerales bacterium]|nr:sodium/proline symporter PutP [Sedimentisphaerales bacterium]
MSVPTTVTFIVYFIFMLGIGLYFYRKSVSIEDYLLGGRGMGAWVTALSAQASDMSGWLLMGLPGAIYLGGMAKTWIAIGLFIGTVLNWKLVAARLRIYTQRTDTITLPCFFEQRFGDPSGLLRTVSAIIILIFFTIYAASGLVATGKLFESTFEVPYNEAVIIGGAVIIAYTFLGGFLAVCWTDLFQGTLMVLALIVVPTVAYFHSGGVAGIREAMAMKKVSASLIPQGGGFPVLTIISAAAWGLGYFGQPHILARFMSVKSIKKLGESMTIAIIWVFFSLGGAVVIGLIGIGMFANLTDGEQEKVFIYMIGRVMHPWLAGIMLAAILSAIMSTIDSQLLVSSSALTEDFYQKAVKKNASQKQVIIVGRICVIIISAIALVLALTSDETILDIVAHAWGGFGAAFGPAVLAALFSRRTSWQAVLAGMVTGTVVLAAWKLVRLDQYMYEIVPGFICNCLTICLVSMIIRQKNQRVLRQYEQVAAEIEAGQ